MYCCNCGKELPEESKFCPSCGSATGPEQSGTRSPAPSWEPMQIDPKLLLIAAGAVIVVLLLVLIFRPGQSKAPVPGDTSQVQQQDPEPDPAAALVDEQRRRRAEIHQGRDVEAVGPGSEPGRGHVHL